MEVDGKQARLGPGSDQSEEFMAASLGDCSSVPSAPTV